MPVGVKWIPGRAIARFSAWGDLDRLRRRVWTFEIGPCALQYDLIGHICPLTNSAPRRVVLWSTLRRAGDAGTVARFGAPGKAGAALAVSVTLERPEAPAGNRG